MYFQMWILRSPRFEVPLLDVRSNSPGNRYYSERQQLTHSSIQSDSSLHLKCHSKYNLVYSMYKIIQIIHVHIHLPVEKDFKLCMTTGGNTFGISNPRNFKLINLHAILNSFIFIFPSASVSDNALQHIKHCLVTSEQWTLSLAQAL